jgi:hypothetical protein
VKQDRTLTMRSSESSPAIGFPWYLVDEIASVLLPSGHTSRRWRALLEGTEIPVGSLVVGLPAKVVRPVDEKALARIDRIWRHYVDQARRYWAGEFPIRPASNRGSGPDGDR